MPRRLLVVPQPPFFLPLPQTLPPPQAAQARCRSFLSSTLAVNCSRSIPFQSAVSEPLVFLSPIPASRRWLPMHTVPSASRLIPRLRAASQQPFRSPTTLPAALSLSL